MEGLVLIDAPMTWQQLTGAFSAWVASNIENASSCNLTPGCVNYAEHVLSPAEAERWIERTEHHADDVSCTTFQLLAMAQENAAFAGKLRRLRRHRGGGGDGDGDGDGSVELCEEYCTRVAAVLLEPCKLRQVGSRMVHASWRAAERRRQQQQERRKREHVAELQQPGSQRRLKRQRRVAQSQALMVQQVLPQPVLPLRRATPAKEKPKPLGLPKPEMPAAAAGGLAVKRKSSLKKSSSSRSRSGRGGLGASSSSLSLELKAPSEREGFSFSSSAPKGQKKKAKDAQSPRLMTAAGRKKANAAAVLASSSSSGSVTSRSENSRGIYEPLLRIPEANPCYSPCSKTVMTQARRIEEWDSRLWAGMPAQAKGLACPRGETDCDCAMRGWTASVQAKAREWHTAGKDKVKDQPKLNAGAGGGSNTLVIGGGGGGLFGAPAASSGPQFQLGGGAPAAAAAAQPNLLAAPSVFSAAAITKAAAAAPLAFGAAPAAAPAPALALIPAAVLPLKSRRSQQAPPSSARAGSGAAPPPALSLQRTTSTAASGGGGLTRTSSDVDLGQPPSVGRRRAAPVDLGFTAGEFGGGGGLGPAAVPTQIPPRRSRSTGSVSVKNRFGSRLGPTGPDGGGH